MRLIGTLGIIGLLACDSPETYVKNVAPEFTSLSVVPDTEITTSSELLCIATAVDENEDLIVLTYVWTDSEGVVLSETAELELNSDISSPSEELTCTATISDGIIDVSESISVTVDNTAPEILTVSITPNEVEVDTLMECSFEANDADGEDLTATYSWTHNGSEVGTESTLQLNPTDYTSNDLVVCTVTVEDGFGGTASDSAEVIVDNTAPIIGSVAITPEMTYSTDVLTCVASDVVDGEGHEVTLTYEWSIDGEVQTETSEILSGPFSVGSEVVCRVTPNDGNLDGQTVEASTTILNTAPVMNDIAITPNMGVEANTLLECSSNSSDIDNEAMTTTYEWTDGNALVLGTSSSLELDSSMVSPGDAVNCTAMVEDVHGDSDSMMATVSIENTMPVVDSGAVISGTPMTDEMLTCSASFSDLNDGTLSPSYLWTKADGTVLSSTDTYMIDATETDVGDELTCTASVVDADGDTISSSASATVQNTLPTLGGVSLSPDPLVSTDDVNCIATGVDDIDADSVSLLYGWSIDGVSQTETSDVLSGPIEVGSVVECSVTPNDGFASGTPMSATLTVDNTAPVVDSVTLDNLVILSDGTVTATASLSDVDSSQSVTANYEWFLRTKRFIFDIGWVLFCKGRRCLC